MRSKINCIIVDDEPTAIAVLKIHLSKIPNMELVGTCKNAIEAFQLLSTQTVDLIFLDINMPEISGLSFAKTISKKTKIIFTTAYREYALDGFDLKAVDYLLKPISFERLLQSVDSYIEIKPLIKEDNLTKKVLPEPFVFVRSDRKMVKIVFSEVCYIESLGDYLKIHFKEKYILTRQTLSSIEVQLPPKEFIRIHRSFIINLYSIRSFTNEQVEVNDQILPISRGYKKEVLARLGSIK
jgi:two-component system LytT family response regulator